MNENRVTQNEEKSSVVTTQEFFAKLIFDMFTQISRTGSVLEQERLTKAEPKTIQQLEDAIKKDHTIDKYCDILLGIYSTYSSRFSLCDLIDPEKLRDFFKLYLWKAGIVAVLMGNSFVAQDETKREWQKITVPHDGSITQQWLDAELKNTMKYAREVGFCERGNYGNFLERCCDKLTKDSTSWDNFKNAVRAHDIDAMYLYGAICIAPPIRCKHFNYPDEERLSWTIESVEHLLMASFLGHEDATRLCALIKFNNTTYYDSSPEHFVHACQSLNTSLLKFFNLQVKVDHYPVPTFRITRGSSIDSTPSSSRSTLSSSSNSSLASSSNSSSSSSSTSSTLSSTMFTSAASRLKIRVDKSQAETKTPLPSPPNPKIKAGQSTNQFLSSPQSSSSSSSLSSSSSSSSSSSTSHSALFSRETWANPGRRVGPGYDDRTMSINPGMPSIQPGKK